MVEKIGIEKSKKSLERADIVLCVLDGTRSLKAEDKEILELAKYKKHLIIVNKNDEKRVLEEQQKEISISAKDEKGIEELKSKIYQMVAGEEIDFSKVFVINEQKPLEYARQNHRSM